MLIQRIIKTLMFSGIWMLAACKTDIPKSSFENVTDIQVQASTKFKVIWQHKITDRFDATSVAMNPALNEAVSYFGDNKGNIVALEHKHGNVLWYKEFNVPITSDLALTRDAVVFGTASAKVFAISKLDGHTLWEVNVASEVLAAPTYNKKLDLILVRTINDNVQVLRASTGEIVWSYVGVLPSLVLRKGVAALNIENEAFACGFASGRISLLDAKSGVAEWEAVVALPSGETDLQRMVDINSSPVLKDDYIYVTSSAGKIVVLNRYTGAVVWERKIRVNDDLVVDDTVLATSSEGVIYSLNLKTGATVWQQEKLKHHSLTNPVVVDNIVVVADILGYIYFVDIQSGDIKSKFFVDNSPFVKLFVVDDMLFGLNAKGSYFAFGAK